MNYIQLYFPFDSEIIVNQWIRNIQKCYMSLPYSFNLKEVFVEQIISNWSNIDDNLVIPMDFICNK